MDIIFYLCSLFLIIGGLATIIFQLFFWVQWAFLHQKLWVIFLIIAFSIGSLYFWCYPMGIVPFDFVWVMALVMLLVQLCGFPLIWRQLRWEYKAPTRVHLFWYFLLMFLFSILFRSLSGLCISC